MQDYYSKLEPVESAEQKTLRQLNEVKQQQIKRMQAMRKRLKKGSQNLESRRQPKTSRFLQTFSRLVSERKS